MTDRIRLDDLTSDQYDAPCERLEAAEGTESQRQLAVAREALASATVRAARAEEISRSQLDLIERIARRARRAEAAIARVRALADEWDLHAPPPGNRPLAELRAALDGPERADTTQPEPDTCRPVDIDGETIRIRGSGEFTEQDQRFAEEIVRAAKRKYAAEHPEPAPAGLRDQLAETLARADGRQWGPHLCAATLGRYHKLADAVLNVTLPATLARGSEATVQRVTALYERWVKAGPPPLGTSVSRWWDTRLAELHTALNPAKEH